jgi:hypothetical protein
MILSYTTASEIAIVCDVCYIIETFRFWGREKGKARGEREEVVRFYI